MFLMTSQCTINIWGGTFSLHFYKSHDRLTAIFLHWLSCPLDQQAASVPYASMGPLDLMWKGC